MNWDYLISPKLDLTVIRASAILTTDYVASIVKNHEGFNTLVLWCEFTIGSSGGFKLKVESSYDGVTWFQEPQYAQAGGVTTYQANEHLITDTGNKPIVIYDIIAKYVRISAKAETDATGTLLKITAQSSILEKD